MKAKILLCLVAVATFCFSCSKQLVEDGSSSTLKSGSNGNGSPVINGRGGGGGSSCTDPRSASNPWDSVGMFHNVVVDYAEQNDGGSSKSFSNHLYYANASLTSLSSTRYGRNFSTYIKPNQDISTILNDSVNNFSNVISNYSSSTAVQSYLTDLVALLRDTTDPDCIDYCNIKSRIVTFEETVQGDRNLSQAEKDEILRVTSIARHSMYYWNQKFLATAGPNSTSKRHWWQWVIIGVCDVAGGIAGAGNGVAGVVSGAAQTSSGVAGAM